MDDGVTRVLLLSANPKDTDQLRLNEEFREIREGLNLSENRALFDIKQGGATRAKDLRRLIFSFNPHIVHFSGHSSTDGIFLESDTGRYNPVTGYALANLFSLFADTVRCVILNACYSREQAIEIVQQIPYVVGMSTRIRDDSAIQFAVGFYDAIGAGRGIEDAYKFGCNAIQLEGGNNLGGSDRSLILPVSEMGDLEKFSDIDEADKPVLLTRVREVKAYAANDENEANRSTTPVTQTIPQQNIQTEPPSSPSVQIQTNESSKRWLPWVLASLIPLIALAFVFWDSQLNTSQDINQSDIVERNIESNSESSRENSSVKSDSNTGNTTEALMARERELEQKQNELRQQAEAQEQAQSKKEELQQELSKKQEAELQEQARLKKQAKNEESTRLQRIREAKNSAKEKALAKRELLIQKAEKARRERQKNIAAAKREKQKERQAKLAEIARQKQAEQERRQWEDQQRAEAARKAWQAKQDEIARKQKQEQQKPPPPSPQKQESAADRMVKEVEELWFDR